MIAPEYRVPSSAGFHSFLPGLKQRAQLGNIRRLKLPLVTVSVIHFQVVEIENHGQLTVLRRGVTDAVRERRGTHLAHGDHSVDACAADHLLQIFVNARAVRIEPPPVAFAVITKDIGF